MKKFLLLFILNIFIFNNSYSFFWGKLSDKKAGEIAKTIENSFEKGNCENVISIYNNYIDEKIPKRIKQKVLKYVGQCYEKSGDIEKAISIYKLSNILYPEDNFFYKKLGNIYFENGFYENSLDFFNKILKDNKNDYEAILFVARIYAKLGFLNESKRYYISYILNTEFKEENIVKEYIELLIKKNDIKDAIFVIDSVKDSNKKYDFLILKSRCMAYNGKYNEAIILIDEAQKLKKLDREAMIRKTIYSILIGNYSLNEEIEYFKNDYFGNFIKGIINYKNKKYNKAIEEFKVSKENGESIISDISNIYIERIKNENKILENVSCRQ